MRILTFLLLFFTGLSVEAQAWNSARPSVAVQVASRSVSISPGEMVSTLVQGAYVPKSPPSLLQSLLEGRTYVPTSGQPGNGTFVDGLRTGPGPTGAGVPFNARRAIPWAATAKAASRALPLIGTALVVKDLYDEIRCREMFGAAGECDNGVPATTVSGWRVNVSPFPTGGTKEAACQALLPTQPCPGGECRAVMPNTSSCALQSRNFAGDGTPGEWVTFWGGWTLSPATHLSCPVVTSPYPQARGRDGLCPTGVFQPADYPVLETKIEQHGDKARAPALWPVLSAAGVPFDHAVPDVTGPAAIPGGRVTINHPDGRTTTRDTEHPITYKPGGYDWQDRVTEREWPAGVTPQPAGAPPVAGTPPATTTTGAPAAAPIEVITCGLPGKPPCKIDESGTPSPDPQNPEADAAVASSAVRGAIAGIGQYVFPAMAWDFALPSNCSPIPAGAFSAFFLNGIDICPHQPMFHDIMSVVWWLGGLFGAIGLFWRDQLAGT